MEKRRRKILIFTLGLIGGAERMAITIGKLLPKDKFEIKFVILGDDRDIKSFIPKDYEICYLPFATKSPSSIFRLYNFIRHEKPDICYGTQARINFHIIIASRLANKKVIIRSSGMVSTYSGLKYWMNKLSLRYANKIIAQQEQMRLEIIQKCNVNPNNIITLQNILDVKTIEAKICEDSPFVGKGNVNYVNVARIHPSKAQDTLIKAFAIVKQSISNAHLYFIGPVIDYYKDYIQGLHNLVDEFGLGEYIHFIGFDTNPYRWVKHCNCFVFPSRFEGLPNALIEASYIGVPCVATKCLDIITEIVKDGYNGYTVNVDDINGFAKGMLNALTLNNFTMTYRPNTEEDYIKLFENI